MEEGMKKYLLFISAILLFLPVQILSQTQIRTEDKKVDYPWVPRISAYEAYVKYKEGKAIILHGGGNVFSKRHILGAFDLDLKDREGLLRKFPKEGVDIFTY
jgi:hypothetical protein